MIKQLRFIQRGKPLIKTSARSGGGFSLGEVTYDYSSVKKILQFTIDGETWIDVPLVIEEDQ